MSRFFAREDLSNKFINAKRPYAGRTAWVATQHAKEKAIKPAFSRMLGMIVDTLPVDTDSLGTFTGAILRNACFVIPEYAQRTINSIRYH
jgi:hypothetical protein